MSRFRRTNRIQIRNVPSQASKDDIEQLVATFGHVQRCDVGEFPLLSPLCPFPSQTTTQDFLAGGNGRLFATFGHAQKSL